MLNRSFDFKYTMKDGKTIEFSIKPIGIVFYAALIWAIIHFSKKALSAHEAPSDA